MQGIRVWSLVRELKSHRPRSYEPEHAIACAPQQKIPHNTIKIQCSQINKYIKKNNNLKKYIIYKKHIVKQKKTPISTLGSWTTSYLFSHTFFYFVNPFIHFNWRLITLQYCSGFCHTFTWISHRCTCIPHPEPPSHFPPHPIPQGCPNAPALSALSHASNLNWWSISHMVIYMFQCCSLKSSHPCLLPQSPKVCSLHLCLFCYLAYRVIITIFLNSIYALIYCISIFLSDLLHSV